MAKIRYSVQVLREDNTTIETTEVAESPSRAEAQAMSKIHGSKSARAEEV
jgi:hypothetical protein